MKKLIFPLLFLLFFVNPCFGQNLLDYGMIGGGANLTSPGPIGSTTPSTGAFSSLTDTGLTDTYIPKAGTGGLLGNSNITNDGTTTTLGSTSAGGNLTVLSTRGSELLPALTTPLWTLGTGWRYDTTPNSLEKYTTGTGTVVPATPPTIIANRTYVLNITYVATVGTFSITLGGSVSITPVSATDTYITTTSTATLTITPSDTADRYNITAYSLKLVSNTTGILTISGPIYHQSMLRWSIPYFDVNKQMQPSTITQGADGGITITTGALNGNGLTFGNLGTATRGIDLSGSGLSGATDYWFYGGTNDYWVANGALFTGAVITTHSINGFNNDDLMLSPAGQKETGFIISVTNSILFGNGSALGPSSNCTFPTANKDYINKTGIGTGLSNIGDMIHVQAGTGATVGYYRVIALVSANSIQVDRNIHASGSDIVDGTVNVFKDVISIHATDGTNGQLLTSWSAQNKPLQLGGTVLAATAGLTSKDIYFGGDIGTGGTVNTTTTNALIVGGGQNVGTKNTGWLQVYIGTALSWIPYWTNATP